MRTTQSLSKSLAACSLALAVVFGTATVNAQTDGSAAVKAVRGSVKYSEANGPATALKSGVSLKVGSAILTGPESTADLAINGKANAVRVAPNSSVSLEKMSANQGDSETRVVVQSGTVIGSVKKLSAASHFDVRTPNGVAGIRGTDFVVTVDGRTVKFTCIQGQVVVAVTAPDGQLVTKVLNDHQTWVQGGEVTDVAPELLSYYQTEVTALAATFTIGGDTLSANRGGNGRNEGRSSAPDPNSAIPASPIHN